MTLNVVQDGANVMTSVSGSAIVTPSAISGPGGQFPFPSGFAYVSVSGPYVVVGSGTAEGYRSLGTFQGSATYLEPRYDVEGNRLAFTASSSSGDVVGFLAGGRTIYVPLGYVSGTSLAATSVYSNQTFSSMGWIPGTYTMTWGSGADQDSLVLNVGISPVPEPQALALMLFGLGIVGLNVRTSRRT